MKTSTLSLLIADDHPVVRQGLKRILDEVPGFTVTAEAANGPEALDAVHKQDFDAVLLDMSMPGMSGLDVLKQIHLLNPDLPVLILSIYPENQYALRVLKAGASGYISKDEDPEKLIEAVRLIARGKKYVSKWMAEKLAEDVTRHREGEIHESLSDRELTVLCMIARGKTVGAIAEELNLSVKTISTYRSRLLQKMGMATNAELTHYAIVNHLVE